MAVVGIPSPAIKLTAASHHRSIFFISRSKCRLLFPIKCSTEAAATADESTASSSSGDEDGVAVVSGGLGRPSIISTANVQKAIRGLPITDVDHYGRLGVPRSASNEQIQLAYKSKCEELKNKGLEEEEAQEELDLLEESYTILSIKEERRLYDWSLARSAKPDRYVWPFEVDDDSMKSPETPPPEEPEDVGPTRLVGYFFLGWIILSFALSVTLNR
ncbi:Chaperone DnaJ-domain superfamily protein [Rhynchospora pubera]|uniref:Chaperone DnaJ-domain superfamily protein n=1 Tax=Rhynchospora pubera TaxID=906938 RepID=A0AAV8CK94_9POAL|nr:Chaperone DnaJ-domain superfamily protein [Rhynchospora pubera]KAJ4790701.1 Chaperone DnaJ-domain superfamily protein [Rhynchospora pubera]